MPTRWRGCACPSGFLIVVVFAWFSRPTPLSMAVGVPISLLGLALRAWAAGCLAKNRELATGGPYAYTRNPLYIGTLLVAAGLAAASRSPGLALLFAACLPAGLSAGDPERGATPAQDFSGIRRLCRAGAGAASKNSGISRKKFESFSPATLSNEPGISSRSGIPGRDAVSPLENAGLRACTLRASHNGLPLIFVIRDAARERQRQP